MAVGTLRRPKSPSRRLPRIERIRRFSVDQYHQMIQANILGEHDRVELLDGWIVSKMTHNPRHDGTIQLIDSELTPHVPAGWLIRIQSAITLVDSEPEPDYAIVRGPVRRYMQAHPGPVDVGVLIEVADSSLDDDRDFKGPLYAQALIPIYWLVNIPGAQIEVYSEPRAGRKPAYKRRTDYHSADMVPLIIDGQEIVRIAVGDLLP